MSKHDTVMVCNIGRSSLVGVAPPKTSADDVVDVAERIIDADGLAALSVRRVANELGASRQVVYTHFDGMHDVLEALHLRSGRQLAESVERLGEAVGSEARLLAGAHAYVGQARRRPAMFELTFGRPVPGYTPSESTTAALRSVFRVHIVGLIDEWHVANRVVVDQQTTVERARVFWSSIHGLVTLERAGHAEADETDGLVAAMVHSLLAGWQAESGV